jgi:hypothetical protein
VVSPRLAVNGVRAPHSQSDDAPANDLCRGGLGVQVTTLLR